VIEAALKEESQRLKGDAVTALSRLSSWGDAETRSKVIDMALAGLEGTAYWQPVELLKKAQDAANFNRITAKVRELIEKHTGQNPDYRRASELVGVLTALKDEGYFTQVLVLAEMPNAELRRKCVDYIATFGTKKDIAELKKLRDRTDAAAEATRTHIDQAITKLENR
jgi:hypothetical protein